MKARSSNKIADLVRSPIIRGADFHVFGEAPCRFQARDRGPVQFDAEPIGIRTDERRERAIRVGRRWCELRCCVRCGRGSASGGHEAERGDADERACEGKHVGRDDGGTSGLGNQERAPCITAQDPRVEQTSSAADCGRSADPLLTSCLAEGLLPLRCVAYPRLGADPRDRADRAAIRRPRRA